MVTTMTSSKRILRTYESLCVPLQNKRSPQRQAVKALLSFHIHLEELELHMLSRPAYVRAIQYVHENLPSYAFGNGPLIRFGSRLFRCSPKWKLLLCHRELCSTLVVYLLSRSRTFTSQTPDEVLEFFTDRYDAFERLPRARCLKVIRSLMTLCQPDVFSTQSPQASSSKKPTSDTLSNRHIGLVNRSVACYLNASFQLLASSPLLLDVLYAQIPKVVSSSSSSTPSSSRRGSTRKSSPLVGIDLTKTMSVLKDLDPRVLKANANPRVCLDREKKLTEQGDCFTDCLEMLLNSCSVGQEFPVLQTFTNCIQCHYENASSCTELFVTLTSQTSTLQCLLDKYLEDTPTLAHCPQCQHKPLGVRYLFNENGALVLLFRFHSVNWDKGQPHGRTRAQRKGRRTYHKHSIHPNPVLNCSGFLYRRCAALYHQGNVHGGHYVTVRYLSESGQDDLSNTDSNLPTYVVLDDEQIITGSGDYSDGWLYGVLYERLPERKL